MKTLKAVLSTLDPTLTDIRQLNEAKDTFLIKRRGTEIFIQEGKVIIQNPIHDLIPRNTITALSPGTEVVFVFDTDVEKTDSGEGGTEAGRVAKWKRGELASTATPISYVCEDVKTGEVGAGAGRERLGRG